MDTRLKLICIFFAFMLGPIVFAQYTDVINSNRPGASQSAFSVGINVLQLEVGPYLIDENRSPYPSFETKGYGIDFAAHYGIFKEALEFNLQGTYQRDTKSYGFTIPVENKRSNFKHLNLGAKYLVYDPNKNKEDKVNLFSYHANNGFKWRDLIPAIAITAGVNFDTENNPYTKIGVEGLSYRSSLITQSNFNGSWVLLTNFIVDRISSNQQEFHYILTLTHALNTKWMIFVEKHGFKSDFYADNLIRFGGGFLMNKDLQLDSAVTLNFKDTPSVSAVNFGVSYRLDRHKDVQEINKNVSAKKQRKRQSQSRKKSKKKKVENFDEN